MGGQKTLRTYWKNYFEKTDTLIWVVDSTDRERLEDCSTELKGLLLEEVRVIIPMLTAPTAKSQQRLMGASLLVFKNKSDVLGALSADEVRKASPTPHPPCRSRSSGIADGSARGFNLMRSRRIGGKLSHVQP